MQSQAGILPCRRTALKRYYYYYYYYYYYHYHYHYHYYYKCKKIKSLKQCLTATRPTLHNQNSKNQKGAITLAARRHNNVNVLLGNTTFLIFAVLVV